MIAAYTYGATFFAFVMIVATVVLVAKNNGKNQRILNALVLTFMISVVGSFGMIIAVSSTEELMAMRGLAMYYTSIDWMLVMLVYFARHYTQIGVGGMSFQFTLAILAGADTINIFANSTTHNCFDVDWTQLADSSEYCYAIRPYFFYNLHLIFCYFMVTAIIIVFIKKIICTAGFHRARYVTILALFVAIIIINALYMALDKVGLDFSIFFYIILGLALAYFSLYYNPHVFVEYMLAQVTDKLECGMVCYDENDQVVYSNQLACLIFNTTRNNYELTKRLSDWLEGKAARDVPDCEWNDIYAVNNVEHHYNIHFNKVYDKKGYYSGCYFSFYDVSADVNAYEEEKFRATHDRLTGALNRDAFYEEARKLIDSNPTTQFLVLCSDIKDFKIINDVFGVSMGDRILINISEIVKANLQDRAVYARMEADRFAVLMPKERFSEKLFIQAMDEIAGIVDNSLYKMHMHIGVYEVTDRTTSIAVMCDRAYMAIDSIKTSYKDRIAYYGDVLRKVYMDEQKIVSEFDRALENGQFDIYLQPQVDRTGEAAGAECLVRWNHPTKGVVQPSEFIEVLEKAGLIYKLDMYVWEMACKQLVSWKKAGKDKFAISVNISAKDFYYIDVYATLTDMVEFYDVAPSQLNLEITETAFMNEPEKQMKLLRNLQDYGFKIEMDDFGSGYSSLSMLKEMPVDILKIDMAFLAVTENEVRSRKIVNMVIALAKVLDMQVITEGVESKEQVDYLTKAGCDIFQGYFFEKPLPPIDFERKYL